ncbi:Cyclopropane-fatty-acyl-phospholipid synthase [Polystyrenella longa]|uniref:Cyclopropane-fatty-acyl-phospholipid synthase n=1 Tax=Polystyrenella longa TaxID=2528007 RepID=A0A518CK71_9PLAN|nr:cyclopropane-fatty-acyl-phospholipid synthase family protein [Polystyrenella longa]QDU79622.1 Cyclopropane-fatty-acyl-phospholipid synthase [Polystyrenella longa]
MFLHILDSAVDWTEKGYFPDSMIRYGVRRLLHQRLEQESKGDCAERQERFQEFLNETRRAPIAVMPEKANEQHYEVPARFFQQALGKRLKYSCCYWPAGIESLNKAEEAALRVTCQRAEIHNGMSILELGCGWGSLTLWMAENYPDCKITAVSNSASQKDYIEQQTRERSLDNVEIVTADMNEFDTQEKYDRVVSIEMFEHMRNHQLLMQKVARWLKPGGQLFVHIFCHREFAYLFETEGPHNWMGRYFFSGGMMPNDRLMACHQRDLKLVRQWRWNGQHYARTCEAWLQRQDSVRAEVLETLADTYGPDEAEKWFVRWRLFFIACAELFAYNGGNEWWVSHYLFQKP